MARFDFVCDADLEPADGDPRMHCARCDTTVHDLSSMTRAEAAALLDGCDGALCGQLRLDAELEPVFAPPGAKRRLALAGGLLAGAAGLTAAVLVGAPDAPAPDASTAARPGAGLVDPTPVDFKSRLDLLIADAVRRAQADDARAVAEGKAPCEAEGADGADGAEGYGMAGDGAEPDHAGEGDPSEALRPPPRTRRSVRKGETAPHRKLVGLLVMDPEGGITF